jgi:hypothetical protein
LSETRDSDALEATPEEDLVERIIKRLIRLGAVARMHSGIRSVRTGPTYQAREILQGTVPEDPEILRLRDQFLSAASAEMHSLD